MTVDIDQHRTTRTWWERSRGHPAYHFRTVLVALFIAGSQVVRTMMGSLGDLHGQVDLALVLFALGLAAWAAWQLHKQAREATAPTGTD